MLKSGDTLFTDTHFKSLLDTRQNVIVYQDGVIVDYGGLIEDLSEEGIKINGVWFLKKHSEFRVR